MRSTASALGATLMRQRLPSRLRPALCRSSATASSSRQSSATDGSTLRGPAVAAGKKQKREDQELWAAHRITWIGAGVNLGSAAAKAVAGVAAASPALLADAAHSLSDLLSDGVALWATKAARRPVSRHTPYGSGKFEALGAVGCSGMILAAGLSVGFHSLSCLPPALAPLLPPDAFTWLPHDLIPSPPPTEAISGYAGLSREQWFGAAAAASGLVAKEVLYRETLRIGNEIRSATLLANAWHHRTDAFSSVVAGVGLLGGALGVPVLDPAAGLIVAGMVTRVGIQMGRDNIAELTDTHAVDEGTLKAIEALALAEDGEALGVTGLRARRLGPAGLSVELRLQVPFHLSVSAAQQAATRARLRILRGGSPPPPASDSSARSGGNLGGGDHDLRDLRVAEVSISLDAERPEVEAGREYSGDVVVGGAVNPRIDQLMRPSAEIVADVRAAIVAGGCGVPGGEAQRREAWPLIAAGAAAPLVARIGSPLVNAAAAAAAELIPGLDAAVKEATAKGAAVNGAKVNDEAVKGAPVNGPGGARPPVLLPRVWGLTHANVHWRTARRPHPPAHPRGDADSGNGGSVGTGAGFVSESGFSTGGGYVGDGAVVEASLIVDPNASVRDAHALAVLVRRAVLAAVPDVAEVDLHVELFDREKEDFCRSPSELPEASRLPSKEEAEARLRGKRVAAKLRRGSGLGDGNFPCADAQSCAQSSGSGGGNGGGGGRRNSHSA